LNTQIIGFTTKRDGLLKQSMAGHSFSELREQHEIGRIASRKIFISPNCFAMVVDLYCYENTSNKIRFCSVIEAHHIANCLVT
jgi:hypothetical protein